VSLVERPLQQVDPHRRLSVDGKLAATDQRELCAGNCVTLAADWERMTPHSETIQLADSRSERAAARLQGFGRRGPLFLGSISVRPNDECDAGVLIVAGALILLIRRAA